MADWYHRGKPVEEERAAAQGQGGRDPGTGQHGAVGGGARHAEPPVAGLGGYFSLRHALRQRTAAIDGASSMTACATSSPGVTRCRRAAAGTFRMDAVFGTLGVLRLAHVPHSGRHVVSLAMKPVGEPDAGNPHVRFDERGGETDCTVAAPRLSSTLPGTGLISIRRPGPGGSAAEFPYGLAEGRHPQLCVGTGSVARYFLHLLQGLGAGGLESMTMRSIRHLSAGVAYRFVSVVCSRIARRSILCES